MVSIRLTIGPLMGDRVKAAVQLTHGDGLGIDDAVHGAELVKGASCLKIAQGISQHLVAHRLATQRFSHNHQTVTHQDHLIHLNTSIIAPVMIVINLYLAHTPETALGNFYIFDFKFSALSVYISTSSKIDEEEEEEEDEEEDEAKKKHAKKPPININV